MRIAYMLTVPLGMVLGLGSSPADARNTCVDRIFQGESEACYQIDGRGPIQFKMPLEEAVAGEEDGSTGFRILKSGREIGQCGCQLRKRNDVICAGPLLAPTPDRTFVVVRDGTAAVVARPNGNGSRLVGESFGAGSGPVLDPDFEALRLPARPTVQQQTFAARRTDQSDCLIQR